MTKKEKKPNPRPATTAPRLVEGDKGKTKRMIDLVRSYKFHRK